MRMCRMKVDVQNECGRANARPYNKDGWGKAEIAMVAVLGEGEHCNADVQMHIPTRRGWCLR